MDRRAAALEAKVVATRRDLHQFPELSNREFETSKKVAAYLKALGLEVQTGIAHTGVVAVLRGGARLDSLAALKVPLTALAEVTVYGPGA